MKFTLSTMSPAQTEELAGRLARALVDGDCVTLSGELGAGKTTFARGLASAMGIPRNDVSSPTFVLAQEYTSIDGRTLIHVDAYRLQGDDELDTLGWDEWLADRDAVLLVEWPERIINRLPRHRVDVRLTHLGPDTREIEIRVPRQWDERFDLAVEDWPGFIIDRTPSRAPSSPAPIQPGCAVCGERLTDHVHAPFCSERCRLVDLGRWFKGEYSITRPLRDDDEIEPPPE